LQTVATNFLKANETMIIVQIAAIVVIFICLAALKVPESAYKTVGVVIVLGSGGLMIFLGVGGWILFGIELLISLIALAIHKDYTVKTPLHIEAYSIGPDGRQVHIAANSGTFVGPGQYAPDNVKLTDGVSRGAAKLAGHSSKEYPSLRGPDEW